MHTQIYAHTHSSWTHTYTHTHTRAHTDICTHTHHGHTHAHTQIYAHTHAHTCTHTDTCTHTHHGHTCTHRDICARTLIMDTHVHTQHMCTHTRVHPLSSSSPPLSLLPAASFLSFWLLFLLLRKYMFSQYLLSVQFSHSVVSDFLQPHGPQHARPPCPSPTPRAGSNSCPSSQ